MRKLALTPRGWKMLFRNIAVLKRIPGVQFNPGSRPENIVFVAAFDTLGLPPTDAALNAG